MTFPPLAAIRRRLLDWYDVHARHLPWRAPPGGRVRADPYQVWLSEVMLQQTTVPHATPYFLRFIERWPTVEALAAAQDTDLMAAWAGLGYYARARNLLTCARVVAGQYGGRFPETEAGLRALPGVGGYTAAAIAAIAFDQPANVVDGNVERVMARLYGVQTPLPAAKPQLHAHAAALASAERPGDWAQALMDLGATICRPKAPSCDACPLSQGCVARISGNAQAYPRRSPKAERPRRHGAAFVLIGGGQVALIRRPPRGLLGGMLGLPTTEWRADPWSEAQIAAAAPDAAGWRAVGMVEHVFTHFALTLQVWRGEVRATGQDGFIWSRPHDCAGLPSVFLKAARLVLDL